MVLMCSLSFLTPTSKRSLNSSAMGPMCASSVPLYFHFRIFNWDTLDRISKLERSSKLSLKVREDAFVHVPPLVKNAPFPLEVEEPTCKAYPASDVFERPKTHYVMSTFPKAIVLELSTLEPAPIAVELKR